MEYLEGIFRDMGTKIKQNMKMENNQNNRIKVNDGMTYLNNKLNMANKMRKNLKLIEGFENSRVNTLTYQMMQLNSQYDLSKNDFINRKVEQNKNVEKCKALCLTKYNNEYEEKACYIGCELMKPKTKNCIATEMTSSDNGGPPSCSTQPYYSLKGNEVVDGTSNSVFKYIFNCDDIELSNDPAINKTYEDICKGINGNPPTFPPSDLSLNNHDLTSNYAYIQDLEKRMDEIKEQLRIETSRAQESSNEQRDAVNEYGGSVSDKISDYREKYSDWEIKKNENNDDYDAYIENLRDKTRTSKVHYYIWLLLATLFTITVIRQIKK